MDLRRFDTVRNSSTSLVCKGEPEVDPYHFLTPLPRLLPPSHARGGFLSHIDAAATSSTSLACKSETEVYSCPLHLPRMQKRAGGGFFSCFDADTPSSTLFVRFFSRFDAGPFLHFPCGVSTVLVVFLQRLDAVCAVTTSLACKSEPEVVFYGVSMPFASPPPPTHATATQWCFFTAF